MSEEESPLYKRNQHGLNKSTGSCIQIKANRKLIIKEKVQKIKTEISQS